MKYENAKEVLPEALLKEVQKYAGGKLLYIPVENETKGWGEASGYRQKLLKRNVMICNRYKSGVTLSELAEEYFLSLDSMQPTQRRRGTFLSFIAFIPLRFQLLLR